MSVIPFYKYQGTGNDFILIDNRSKVFSKDKKLIKNLCDRKFGIGSDGLILLEEDFETDFRMVFYNPDGSETFCGNGSRCIVAFARLKGLINENAQFVAFDGFHNAFIKNGWVRVKMADVENPKEMLDGYSIYTGTPHFVKFVNNVNGLEINQIGLKIRNRTDLFGDKGTNVNFISEQEKGLIFVRTYERGVEAETLSCGTGVAASAIVYGLQNKISKVKIETRGGNLLVEFMNDEKGDITDVYLSGAANLVYEGKITV